MHVNELTGSSNRERNSLSIFHTYREKSKVLPTASRHHMVKLQIMYTFLSYTLTLSAL